MKPNKVKKQHYVPSGILSNFVNSQGKIFEALLEKHWVYETTPANAMCSNYTYEHPYLEVNTLENTFQKIENIICPVIKAIITELNKDTKEINLLFVKETIEKHLKEFLIFYYRSGALLYEFDHDQNNTDDKILLLLQKILDANYIADLARVIKDCYKFGVIKSFDNEFLISDQFISTAALKIKNRFTTISNRHIGLRNTLILIPISNNYYIVYYNCDEGFILQSNGIKVLDAEELQLVNNVIVNNSYQKCVGTKQKTLQDSLNNYHFEKPHSIYVGYKSGYTSGAILKKEVFFFKEDREAYEFLTMGAYFHRYDNVGRNDKCPCSSGKKFKACHYDLYQRIKIPIQNLINQGNIKSDIYGIPNAITIEQSVHEWGG